MLLYSVTVINYSCLNVLIYVVLNLSVFEHGLFATEFENGGIIE